jgi:hypothetical protein
MIVDSRMRIFMVDAAPWSPEARIKVIMKAERIYVSDLSQDPSVPSPTGALSDRDSTQCFTDSPPRTLPLQPHRQ